MSVPRPEEYKVCVTIVPAGWDNKEGGGKNPPLMGSRLRGNVKLIPKEVACISLPRPGRGIWVSHFSTPLAGDTQLKFWWNRDRFAGRAVSLWGGKRKDFQLGKEANTRRTRKKKLVSKREKNELYLNNFSTIALSG